MNELPATREEMLTFLRESDISDSWVMDAMAAEQGEAQYNLGVMYANGEGVAKDDEESVKWYRKAAEQGLAAAKEFLKETPDK